MSPVVTGGSRGIGRAIAQALARAGADVALNYRERAGEAQSAADEIGRAGCRCVAVPADVSRKADWDRVIEVNLKSCFLMTQAVLAPMRERRWGRIINLSSVAAQTGGVVGPHYAASKAGMIGMTHFYASRLVRMNPNARPELIPIGRFGAAEEVAYFFFAATFALGLASAFRSPSAY